MLARLLGEPTATYCEKAIGEVIKRPGYALTDFAYIVVGIYLIFSRPKSDLAKAFGIIAIIIGSFSLYYDAVNTYFSQLLDLGGMFSFVGLLLYLNLKEISKCNLKKFLSLFIPVTVIAYFFTFLIGGHGGNYYFLALIFGSIGTEAYLQYKKKRSTVKYWVAGLVLFTIGALIWTFDASKTFCDPTNILNGRGIYHYITALCIYFLFLHYSSQESK